MKNIKSHHIINITFLYLNERRKLKMIKHNKSLQNILNISINNYKLFVGKYIIFESNRIGKEYDACNDSLIFEGEYLNGERNGKGKEYNWNDDLEFEGEYLN